MKTSHHPNLYPIARRFCAAVGLEPLPVVPAFPRIVAADLEDDDEDDDNEDDWDDDDDMDDDFDDETDRLYTEHGCPVG